ncbi:gluconate 5-dehydrogenase [Yersinia pseudotuberculosis]
MDVFTASLRSACSLRRGHFVNNLKRLMYCIRRSNCRQ